MLEQTRFVQATAENSGFQAKRVTQPVSGQSDLPDLLLVERTRAHEPQAFELLMRRHNRRLYRIARSILLDATAAEHAVEAAYLRAHANLDGCEPPGKFSAWLGRLAFNEALGQRRPSGPGSLPVTNMRPVSFADTTGGPIGADASAGRREVETAIDALPEVFRTVLVLRVVEEWSGVQVAVCLGLNETTVRTRLYRAQQRLKVDIARRLRADPLNLFELTTERADRIVAAVSSRLQSRPAGSP